ncbi:DUF1636 family protein [Cochlodiniinecator piscidefendens]|uniref:DUF1636 family protein n=1 Tax=Cochlodiniinecator piscidefendens TaxID=2715756 RepID=UPI00140BAED8|nr:DUF1636 domain-containing protein [Cochlodiniinecator piscidefendens]
MGTPQHRITICTSCKSKGTEDRPGYKLITKLRAAIDAADNVASEDFQVSGVACMAGCDRPCTVAYQGAHKATYLFGGITPEDDIDDLIAFARQYAVLGDGWCSSVDRPGKLRKNTLARVPATLVALESTAGCLS